jgi:uncharacterized protein YjbI with pentapeptide repeats
MAMRQRKTVITVLGKLWRSPFALGAGLLAGLLIFLWFLQQGNISVLTRRMRSLKQQIKELPAAVVPGEELDRQMAQMKQQIEALPAVTTQKDQLTQQINRLEQQINTLPPDAVPSNLARSIALMQEQIATIPTLTPQKTQLVKQFAELQQQVGELSAFVNKKEQLLLRKDQLAIEQDQITLQNTLYSSLIQAFVGMFFLATAYFTWRHVQAIEGEQIIERFGKAVDQLSSDVIEVRSAGIYAMERVAKDSEKDHWVIMEVLASFVRSKATRPTDLTANHLTANQSVLPAGLEPSATESSLPGDVRSALKALGRRDVGKDPEDKRLDLSQTLLAEGMFKGFSFKRTDFRQTDLRDANLRETDLRETDFTAAQLERACLGLANLKQAVLTAANLHQCELIGATLREANLVEADLSDADLRGVDLWGANLKAANLVNTNFKGADLRGARNLTVEQLKPAIVSETTQLPEPLRSQLAILTESTSLQS